MTTHRTDLPRPAPDGPARRHHPIPIRTQLLHLFIVLMMTMWAAVGVSYVRAIVAPGYATFADKTSGWLRDHGAGPIVDRVENWYYTHTTPSQHPADTGQFAAGVSGAGAAVALPTLPTPVGAAGTPRWRPVSTLADGTPVVYTSSFEPDAVHPSIVAGVAVISTAATTVHLMTGTQQPRTSLNQSAAQVPARDMGGLAAVFNSGFRFGDITGGIVALGRQMRPLQDGQATAAIDDRGHLTVGQWGRDLTQSRHLVAARQNLDLIVDHSSPLPRPGASGLGWGGTHLQYQYTWRSGLGIDSHNNVVYVAGNRLNLATLAVALVDADAVRGMELDMHTGTSAFISWQTTSTGRRTPTKLMSSMPGPITRYLTPDRRDFFYVTTGPPSPPNASKPHS